MRRYAAVMYAAVGAGLVAWGLWLIYEPACIIWAGAYCLVDAWRLANVQSGK